MLIKKSGRRLSIQIRIIVSQAAINAGLDFRLIATRDQRRDERTSNCNKRCGKLGRLTLSHPALELSLKVKK